MVMSRQIIRLEQAFVSSAAVLLLLTAVAKLFSLTGSVGILDTRDPVFSFLNTRQMLLLVALIEIAVASFVLLRRMEIQTDLLLIAWLGSLFGLYRLALWFAHSQKPCKCLGGALDWTGLSDTAIRGITFAMFVYLLLGGPVLLFVRHL